MALTLADIDFLRSDRASAILAVYAATDLSEANTLPLLSGLRKSLTMQEASAVLQTLKLRAKAVAKFSQHAHVMLFTDSGLQQASHRLIRQYRAGLIDSGSVLDLCCGIGSDTFAFSAAGNEALGLDIDPVRVAIARHNAEAIGVSPRFDVADIRESIPAGYDCIFYDPGRRDEQGRRIHDVARYRPPLSLVEEWQAREIIVKLSPAVDLRQLESYGGCVEFISVDGHLTEALLWLKRPSAPPMATRLTETGEQHFCHDRAVHTDIAPPKRWLFEPDPAIMRAGLVQNLAVDLNATMLDDTIAYLTMDHRVETPWGRYWKILDWMPFQLKRLRTYLVERDVGQVTVKKRGFPMSPEELLDRLRLKDGAEGRVLVMTRRLGKPIAIICAAGSFG
jgi:SAM-dependent methyltransferase